MTEKIKPVQEQYIFIEGDISVGVLIDYTYGRISLVDTKGQPQKWIFAEREVGYMQGWQAILATMGRAIVHAQERLDSYQKIEREEFAGLLANAQDAVADHVAAELNRKK